MSYFIFAKSFAKKCSLALILSLCLAQLSYAQQTFIQNEALAELGSPALGPSAATVDSKGILYTQAVDPSGEVMSVIPISNATNLNGVGAGLIGWRSWTTDAVEAGSTTTVLNLTAHVAEVGDVVRYRTAGANQGAWSPVCSVTTNTVTLCNALPITPTAADNVSIGKPAPISVSGTAANNSEGFSILTAMTIDNQTTNASYLLKAEDGAAASGDALVGVAAIRSDTLGSTAGTNGDYAGIIQDSSGALWVHPVFGTGNGHSISGITSAATNNSTALKGAAGNIYSVLACNTTAALKYVKIYNKATAPTCGTDTPVIRITVPASSCAPTLTSPGGIQLGIGIGYCIVTGAADTDNTAVAANDVFLNIAYQ